MCNICVTNRHLVEGDFFEQIKRVLEQNPQKIILREKDLAESEYEVLARRVQSLCANSATELVLHSFPQVAERLGICAIHMPLARFLAMPGEEKAKFETRGVSVHSVEDALLAEKSGATYLTAGHIFETDCKKGVPPRGLLFLKEVCASVSIPVYAIGGIHKQNASLCIGQGAAGVCMMSSYMKSGD
jgi:thiamine-phosphate pyrophosphorylase